MDIKVKKLRENAIIPKQSTSGAAGFDLVVSAFLYSDNNIITTDSYYLSNSYSHDTIRCATGLAFEIPEGYCMKILPRSGLAFKEGVTVINSPGLIDSDYRGEVIVGLIKHNTVTSPIATNNHTVIRIGDRIAQAVIEKYEKPNFIEAEELSDTDRGEGKFGSTGK